MSNPPHQISLNENRHGRVGIKQMTDVESLPLLRPEIQVHYEGSIDKLGQNDDWDWWLYEDIHKKEWVICEADGPGCLWNFVVHHALIHSDPVYRFYFDGKDIPSFEIKHSEFGMKHPFVAPLADKFQPDVSRDPRLKELNFQIVRSFCPMPFVKSMKITSSVKLQGNHTTGGGWGHAIWHEYPTSDQIETFTGKEDYSRLITLWKQCGDNPNPNSADQIFPFSQTLYARKKHKIFKLEGIGSISGICLKIEPADRAVLNQVWIRIGWDGETSAALECPIGAFFGNELGFNQIGTLMQGTRKDGEMYCYWPMPFWESAIIELENRLEVNSPIKVGGTVIFKPSSVVNYPRNRAGHYRSSAYQPMALKEPNRDSHIASVWGNGHMVAGVITGDQSGCEGDVRVYIDDRGTPAVESDGSESWACYGWGFAFPPQENPASSYDGFLNQWDQWSMLRLLIGDFYPFRSNLRMMVEGGSGIKTGRDLRSGIVFWYGEPEPAMILTDYLDVGESESEKSHKYIAQESSYWELTSMFEGEYDDVPITDQGRTLSGPSEFSVKVIQANQGVILRRRSDQALCSQNARVSVDGQCVWERNWLFADRNPHFRWLEDEFFIPSSYTTGKDELRIRIEPIAQDGKYIWNESFYWVYCLYPHGDLKSHGSEDHR